MANPNREWAEDLKDFPKEPDDSRFPKVNPGWRAAGDKVLLQLARAKRKTAAGLILPDESVDHDAKLMNTAKVIDIGPGAYLNDDGSAWPGGAWCKVGDIVRAPKYGGDLFTKDGVDFKFFRADDIIGIAE